MGTIGSYVVAGLTEVGLVTLAKAPRDAHLLCLQRFLRMFGFGQSMLVLALFFRALGFNERQTGLFMSLTLAGDMVLSLVLTVVADGAGRRRVLAAGSVLMATSGVVFSYASAYGALLAAAVVGVISPSGNEVGPFRAIEESTLAHLVPLADRSDVYAWYALIGQAGTALGAFSAGWLVQWLQDVRRWPELASYRLVFLIYTVLAVLKLAATVGMSSASEADAWHAARATPEPEDIPLGAVAMDAEPAAPHTFDDDDLKDAPVAAGAPSAAAAAAADDRALRLEMQTLDPVARPSWVRRLLPAVPAASRLVLLQLVVLFALDSFGSGIGSQTWISYYFSERFDVAEGRIGSILFVTNIVAALSALVASSISKRIGPVLTMVGTHLPSSVVLGLFGLAGSQGLATVLLVVRSCTQSMDVAPRQAFLSAVVSKAERTAVMGVVNVFRTLASMGGLGLMGALAYGHHMSLAFVIASACKVVYDLAILYSFRRTQLHER
ncbi:major facilitator superfamily domain-containing protein [Dipodascopsis tothii]|uniref:major facilitator superfamily domain-containing protein n=1 Tax=Dipodascopsis tothii TaxID=44089 RepID=UPI0034CD75E6